MRVLGRVERFRDRLQLDVRTLEAARRPTRRRSRRRCGATRTSSTDSSSSWPARSRTTGLARHRGARSAPTTSCARRCGVCRRRSETHHSYAGGLLEHTVGVATICRETAQLHPRLRSDLLLAAALLHDVGRVAELTAGPTFRQTDEGRLLGHVHLGLRMVEERSGALAARRALGALHAIACHHDARAARTAEAAVLYHANQLDAVAATRPIPD